MQEPSYSIWGERITQAKILNVNNMISSQKFDSAIGLSPLPTRDAKPCPPLFLLALVYFLHSGPIPVAGMLLKSPTKLQYLRSLQPKLL